MNDPDSKLGNVFRRPSMPRPPLLRQDIPATLLDEAIRHPEFRIAVVQAPAGFGKTVALTSFSEEADHRSIDTVWINCGKRHADPQEFLQTLVSALSASGITARDEHAELHQLLGRRSSPLWFCLDGFEAAANADVERTLAELLSSTPQCIKVIVGTRQPLQPWFIDYEVAGLGRLVSGDNLRFTQQDIERIGTDLLSVSDISLVARDTSGWPVAVRLALLRSNLRSEFPDSATCSYHQEMFRYIEANIFDDLDEVQRKFLEHAALLTSIDPFMSDEIFQREDSAQLLQSLSHLDPLISIQSRINRATLSPLFRAFLLTKMNRKGASRVRDLHRRAAKFYAAAGVAEEAIEHLLKINDLDEAICLIEREGVEQMIWHLGLDRSTDILHKIPTQLRHRSPQLILFELVIAASRGRNGYAAALHMLLEQILEAQSADDSLSSQWAAYARVFGAILLAFVTGDLRRTDDALKKLAGLEEHAGEFLRLKPRAFMLVRLFSMPLFARQGKLHTAQLILEQYGADLRSESLDQYLSSMNPFLAFIAFLSGNLDEAMRHSSISLDNELERGLVDPSMQHIARAMMARVYYERAEIRSAERMLSQIKFDTRMSYPEIIVESSALRMQIGIRSGHVEDANIWIADCLQTSGLADSEGVSLSLRAIIAEGVIRRATQSDGDNSVYEELHDRMSTEIEAGGQAVVMLQRSGRAVCPWLVRSGRAAEAGELATRIAGIATDQNRSLVSAEFLLLGADAAFAAGDWQCSAEAISEAMRLTARGGAIQVFVDLLGEARVLLFQSFAGIEDPDEGLRAHFRSIMRLMSAEGSLTPQLSLLTDRERDTVIECAGDGSVKAAARSLGVSPETVKHHLSSVYRKLDVSSRSEAVSELARRI